MNTRSLFQKLELYYERIYSRIGEQIVYCLDDINRIPDIRPVVPIDDKRLDRVDDLLPYKDQVQLHPFWDRYVYYLAHGAVMYIFLLEGTVIGHSFVSNLSTYKPFLMNKHPVFGTGNHFFFWGMIYPEYRNMKLGNYMTAVVARDCLERGGVAYGTVTMSNIRSRRMLSRIGFVEIGKLHYTEIAGLRLRSQFIPANPADTEESGYQPVCVISPAR